MPDELDLKSTPDRIGTDPVIQTAHGPDVVRQWLMRAASAHPNKPWLESLDDNRSLRYGELLQLSKSIAGYLASLDIGTGDRIVLLANNSLEHLAVYVSVLAAGATICTIHIEMNRSHFDTILSALNPRLVLYEEGLGLEQLAASTAAPCQPLGVWAQGESKGFFGNLSPAAEWSADAGSAESDAVIYFTSGTGARPKGVVHTYRELITNAIATAEMFGITDEDRIYDYRSFNWASAQILSALAPLSKGATLILRRKFSRSRFFTDIARLGATIAAGNPTVINMLLQGTESVPGAELSRLRFITSSSAPLLAQEWRRFEERFGVVIAQGYGSSETGWIAGCTEKTRCFGSVGKPAPYHRLAIVDRDGRELPPNQIGYVEVRSFGDNVFRYISEDGNIHVSSVGRARTGDMGYLDVEGYLYLTGREKDLIIRGGVNISPLEIDNILMQMPEIVEAATIGVPDQIYGEEVVSYVVVRPDAQVAPSGVKQFCAANMSSYKAPKQVLLCDALPKTERGKLDRKALVERWCAANLSDVTKSGRQILKKQ